LPLTAPKESNLATSSEIKESKKSASKLAKKEASFVLAVMDFPQAHDPSCKVDYKVSTKAYKNY